MHTGLLRTVCYNLTHHMVQLNCKLTPASIEPTSASSKGYYNTGLNFVDSSTLLLKLFRPLKMQQTTVQLRCNFMFTREEITCTLEQYTSTLEQFTRTQEYMTHTCEWTARTHKWTVLGLPLLLAFGFLNFVETLSYWHLTIKYFIHCFCDLLMLS